MRAVHYRLLGGVFLGATLLLGPPVACANGDWKDGFSLSASAGDRVGLFVSPITLHFRPSDEHKHVWLIGVQRERKDGHLAGAAYFSNSFGQPSAYVYPWGKIYRGVFGTSQLYVKWTAGLMYGYKGPYKDKVPFNHGGFSPAIIPAVGWEFEGRRQVQLNALGLNGMMLQFGLPLE